MGARETNHAVFSVCCAVLAIVILLAITLGGAMLTATTHQGPRLFVNWFRHLTNWNAIICAVWLLTVASSRLDTPSPTLLGFGYLVALLNLFVIFVRWGWFRVANLWQTPQFFFSDVIIHALVPIVTCASVVMVAEGGVTSWTEQRKQAVYGIVAFWALVLLWYGINFVLKRCNIVSWPYPNGAGKTLPKDIYKGPRTARAFWFYMGNNIVAAAALSGLVAFYVFARADKPDTETRENAGK